MEANESEDDDGVLAVRWVDEHDDVVADTGDVTAAPSEIAEVSGSLCSDCLNVYRIGLCGRFRVRFCY